MGTRKPRTVVSFEQRQEANRKRRLTTYPHAFFELVEVARKGETANVVFEEHNRACAVMMRYYRFRADVIEDGFPNAGWLRQLVASGINGDGTIFSTRRPEAPGPYTIYWRCYADAALPKIPEDMQTILDKHAAQPPAGIIKPHGKGEPSAAEQVVMDYLGMRKRPEVDSPSADEARLKDIPLDIPSLDLSPQGPPLPTCPPHELDPATGTRCIKCGKPEEAW